MRRNVLAEIVEAIAERVEVTVECSSAVPAALVRCYGEEVGLSPWAEAELKAQSAAAVWQPLRKAQPCKARSRRAKEPPVPLSFDEMHEGFLRQHRESVLAALRRVFLGEIELRPAPVPEAVKSQFLQRCKGGHTIRPVFHGTKAVNHAPIFRNGLMIPNAANGVAVSNGCAHGLGIYTAKLSNPYLSRSFCSEPRLLVCAVVDDAIPLSAPRPCGRFFVTAESAGVRHVGDAIVVKDPARVAPLFEAAGGGFATASSFVPRAAVPAQAAASLAPSVPAARPPTAWEAQAAAAAAAADEARRKQERKRARRRRTAQPPPTGLALFLARRAVQRRLL